MTMGLVQATANIKQGCKIMSAVRWDRFNWFCIYGHSLAKIEQRVEGEWWAGRGDGAGLEGPYKTKEEAQRKAEQVAEYYLQEQMQHFDHLYNLIREYRTT